jgi:hypothetical protein
MPVCTVLERSTMRAYSPGRGRKKAVKRFTTGQGLWMASMIGAATLGILLLFLFGFFHVD